MNLGEESVGVIGGGSWGTTIAKLVGENLLRRSNKNPVRVWVYEEKIENDTLTNIMTKRHENVKYLPGITLPENVVALPDIKEVIAASKVLIIAVPHAFLEGVLSQMEGCMQKDSVCVVLTKGIFFKGSQIALISSMIKERLGVEVCVLMGANIATDVAKGVLSECTLGWKSREVGLGLVPLFDASHFRVTPVEDFGMIEVCGTLKNVVAVGYGIVGGHGHGSNTLAAVLRNGLLEMVKFCDVFVKQTSTEVVISKVFFESSGIADLIVTCMSGRNSRFSKMAAEKKMSIEDIEKTEMNGQKLEGYSTAREFRDFLNATGKASDFPFLYAICESALTDVSADRILSVIQNRE